MAIAKLLESCGLYIVDHNWSETPFSNGEIRAYTNHGDLLEFAQEYKNLKERRLAIADALLVASNYLKERG